MDGQCGNECGCQSGASRRVVSRRRVLTGSAAAVTAMALSACASTDEAATGATGTATGTPGTAGSESPSESPSEAATPTAEESAAESETPSESAAAGGEVLAVTGDFPAGGGAVVKTAAGVVVVTQPADGDFKAFNGRCPHAGCPVTEVTENMITCSCHGSVFDAATGERREGPAPSGLEPVAITVDGDQIRLA